MPPAMGAQSHNLWTAREVPCFSRLLLLLMPQLCEMDLLLQKWAVNLKIVLGGQLLSCLRL